MTFISITPNRGLLLSAFSHLLRTRSICRRDGSPTVSARSSSSPWGSAVWPWPAFWSELFPDLYYGGYLPDPDGSHGRRIPPAAPALISTSVKPEHLGRSLGFHVIGGSSSYFLAPLIGVAIAAALGWRGAFIGLAVPTVFLGHLLFFPDTPQGRRP